MIFGGAVATVGCGVSVNVGGIEVDVGVRDTIGTDVLVKFAKVGDIADKVEPGVGGSPLVADCTVGLGDAGKKSEICFMPKNPNMVSKPTMTPTTR